MTSPESCHLQGFDKIITMTADLTVAHYSTRLARRFIKNRKISQSFIDQANFSLNRYLEATR